MSERYREIKNPRRQESIVGVLSVVLVLHIHKFLRHSFKLQLLMGIKENDRVGSKAFIRNGKQARW